MALNSLTEPVEKRARSPRGRRNPSASIEKRNLVFEIEKVDIDRWHAEGKHVSHFLNSLSIFFPEGESFFIDAVRHYADRVDDPKLREQIEGFTGQEAMHSREHRRYNRALQKAGHSTKELEGAVVTVLDVVRKVLGPRQQLAVTIALEHYTAILAHVVLEREDALPKGSDPIMASVWRWHAIEETEHKAVAFDTYRYLFGRGPLIEIERAIALVGATALFWPMVFAFQARLVAESRGLWSLRGWGRVARLLFWKPGVFPRIALPFLDYFRPGFHPSDQETSKSVASWKALYDATGDAPASA